MCCNLIGYESIHELSEMWLFDLCFLSHIYVKIVKTLCAQRQNYWSHLVDLLNAYEKRHIPTLERRLNRARACNYNNILDSEIVLASRLLDRLNTLKNLRKEVMMTDTKALTELKRYTCPPAGIHEVMSCTLLLLGHPPWEIDVGQ